jgi:aspartate 1-decarboxylase
MKLGESLHGISQQGRSTAAAMLIPMLQAKLHQATITGTLIDYEGSIAIDTDLITAVGMRLYQQVQVYDITNGARFETYVIPGKAGSGEVCVNGAAARLVMPGDRVIVAAYVLCSPEEADALQPKVALLGTGNRIQHSV